MLTRGEYTNESGTYGVILSHTKLCTEAVLVQSGLVVSAYKSDDTGDYSFNNVKAKEMVQLIKAGVRGCTSKNGVPGPFKLGAITTHEFTKTKVDYVMQIFKGELVGCLIESDTKRVELNYYEEQMQIPQGIKYIKLSSSNKDIKVEDDDLNSIPVRSVEEIMLEKEDVTWLRNKKYYIVNDDATAEQIFAYLDNYNGAIAYDTETTGLRINCFGKIGSDYQKTLIKYNEEHPNEQIRSDKLVGIIFCIENDVSYYFPCFNRKFKNLYEDKDSPIRKQIINNTKARYTLGNDLKYPRGDMYNYIMNTPEDEWSPDVILMERVRNILETKHIVAHNGAYEWKVDWMYEIDTNLKDDTMIMHQIMYKFRSTTSNRGESSSLKYLAKVELGIDQWELDDFFPDFKEDDSGLTRAGGKGRKKKGSKIDFSYMDYEGTRIYAPTDGDVTYQLFMKYKTDMLHNHKEQKYIYEVEIVVACAVAYMEFYGHRLDEDKILNIREQTRANIVILESQIRQHIEYSSDKEIEIYNKLNETLDSVKEAENANDNTLVKELMKQVTQLSIDLKKEMDESKEHPLNLASPSQVADLFYKSKEEGGLGYKFSGEKPSVAKKEIKALVQEKNEDGTPKNLVAVLYSEYKKQDTLMVKFFDNLPYYMYPGGYIFSSYGQISTATGRMSCSKPNAQQYPKAITKIVAPRPGYVMIDADYSQIEYRVLTALAKNAGLAELFKNPDSDYHTLMASLMFEVEYAAVTKDMRSQAKSFNFGIPYGMGPGSLAILLTGRNTKQTRDEAIEKTAQYFKNQPNTKKFFENVKEQAQVNKYTRTLFNRYRFYSFEDKDGKVNNAKKAAALRQAGNAVIQGTAADIFKLSVARNFSYIRNNRLYGDFLIINMIHDEQLTEINVEKLNIQRIARDMMYNMQYDIEGFPPLFIGAGVGMNWAFAKGGDAEMHPMLLQQLADEADTIPIRKDTPTPTKPEDVVEYFQQRIKRFSREKLVKYLTDPENWHKAMHPANVSLLNDKFSGERAKLGLSTAELTAENLKAFIDENNLDVKPEWFTASDNVEKDKEVDKEFDEDEEGDELEEYDAEYEFTVIDESDKVFGASLHDLISTFKIYIIKDKVVGIDTKDMYYKTKDAVVDYLAAHACDEDDPHGMEIVFLTDANVLNRTGIKVKDINPRELELRYKYHNKNV